VIAASAVNVVAKLLQKRILATETGRTGRPARRRPVVARHTLNRMSNASEIGDIFRGLTPNQIDATWDGAINYRQPSDPTLIDRCVRLRALIDDSAPKQSVAQKKKQWQT
jgi:hypothetical protein